MNEHSLKTEEKSKPFFGPGSIYAGSMPPPAGYESNYAELNRYAQKGQIVLVGSSLMAQFPINELMMSGGLPGVVYNRAVSCNTAEFLSDPDRMEHAIFELEPGKLFMNLGTRDVDLPGNAIENLAVNYRKIIEEVQERLPQCKIHIIAFYPRRAPRQGEALPPTFRSKETIEAANNALKQLAAETGCTFIDMNACISDGNGYLRDEFAADVIHIRTEGYYALLQEIVKYF